MKFKTLLLNVLCFVALASYAQDSSDKIIYLDSLSQETTNGNHDSYRIVKDYYIQRDFYTFTDYYKSGKIQTTGKSTKKDYISENGEVLYYYENGNLKQQTNFNKNIKSGKHHTWYENGNKKLEGEYVEKKEGENRSSYLKINQFWGIEKKHDVINGNGFYLETEKNYSASGNIRNGLKDSIWSGRHDNPQIIFSETYKNGKLLSGTSTDKFGIAHDYREIEIRPEAKGGIMGFYKYIMNNFRAPEKEGINGSVISAFIIETDGSVSNVKVIKSLGFGADEEAIRVISAYKDWSPGILRGVPVKVKYSIPIKIQTPD